MYYLHVVNPEAKKHSRLVVSSFGASLEHRRAGLRQANRKADFVGRGSTCAEYET